VSTSDRQSIARNAAAIVIEAGLQRQQAWHLDSPDKFRELAKMLTHRAQIMYDECCKQLNVPNNK